MLRTKTQQARIFLEQNHAGRFLQGLSLQVNNGWTSISRGSYLFTKHSLQPCYFLGGNQKLALGLTLCHRILRCSSYSGNKFSREMTVHSCLLPFCLPGMSQFSRGSAQTVSLVLRKSMDTQCVPMGPKARLGSCSVLGLINCRRR